MTMIARIATVAMLMAGAPLAAQDGNDWKFQLVNRSGTAITSVYTIQRNGKWSGNWIKARIAPSQTFNMTFTDASDERCEVRTRIVFTDGSNYDTPVDYCGITKVIVTDTTVLSE